MALSSQTSITFLGDICLARSLYGQQPSDLVESTLSEAIGRGSYVVGNLESVLKFEEIADSDHLDFQGDPKLLEALKFIDLFGLANNHINDFGDAGIKETLEALEGGGFEHCGVNDYVKRVVIGEREVEIIFAADMMNKAFGNNQNYKVLDLFSAEVDAVIERSVSDVEHTVLYAHTGLLFCAFPSVKIRDRLRQLVEHGLSAVITTHSHCTGGIEWYSGVPIVYSVGDTIMDGSSFRRRQSLAIDLRFSHNKLEPKVIDLQFRNSSLGAATKYERAKARLKRGWFSLVMSMPRACYRVAFNSLYRLSMLAHILSTVLFLLSRLGLSRTLQRLALRKAEVYRFLSWIGRDRRSNSTDYDAISPDRKIIRPDELR